MKKTTINIAMAFSVFIALALTSCNGKDERDEAEDKEAAKVGKVYDKEQQGIEHETRENQFPYSRNDNKQGTGLETGAPSDTTAAKETTPQAQAN